MESELSVGLTIRKLNNAIRRDIEKTNAKNNISAKGVHGWAIKYFYENKDIDIFQRDFEEKFSIRRSTATQILKLMEKNGLIVRKSVESDARLKKIILTDKAEDILKIIDEDIKRREKRMRENISKSDLEVFFSVCEVLIKNLEGNDD